MAFLQSNQMDTKTMNTFHLAALLPALFVISTAIPLEAEKVSLACEAGNVTAGTNASVTCYFSKNITKSIHHVYVSFYPANATEDSEHPSTNQHPITNGTKRIQVLVCFRIDRDLQCKEKEGYHFDKEDLNTLRFVINHTTPAHAGHYSCQLVPPDDLPSELCYLHVESIASEITSESSPNETTTSDSEPGKPDQGSTAITVMGIIIGILFLALVAVAILLMHYFRCCKGFRRKGKLKKLPASSEQDHSGELVDELARQGLITPPAEISAVVEGQNIPFDFEEWSGRLPVPVKEALINNGFDTLDALMDAAEDDIQALNLLRGHQVALRSHLETLRNSFVRPRRRSIRNRPKSYHGSLHHLDKLKHVHDRSDDTEL